MQRKIKNKKKGGGGGGGGGKELIIYADRLGSHTGLRLMEMCVRLIFDVASQRLLYGF